MCGKTACTVRRGGAGNGAQATAPAPHPTVQLRLHGCNLRGMPRAGWRKPESDRRLSDLVSVGVLTRVFPAAGTAPAVTADRGRRGRRPLHRGGWICKVEVAETPCSTFVVTKNRGGRPAGERIHDVGS